MFDHVWSCLIMFDQHHSSWPWVKHAQNSRGATTNLKDCACVQHLAALCYAWLRTCRHLLYLWGEVDCCPCPVAQKAIDVWVCMRFLEHDYILCCMNIWIYLDIFGTACIVWPVALYIYIYPIGSMYAIYANIWGIFMVNVTIYSIHGSYGYDPSRRSPGSFGATDPLFPITPHGTKTGPRRLLRTCARHYRERIRRMAARCCKMIWLDNWNSNIDMLWTGSNNKDTTGWLPWTAGRWAWFPWSTLISNFGSLF